MRLVHALTATTVAAALLNCRTSSPGVVSDAMPTFVCDTALKREMRWAQIPDVTVAEGYGSLTGVVFRAGKLSGIDSASIMLFPQDSGTTRSYRVRLTDQTGGFAFDSVIPGRYRLRVLAPWERPDSSFVVIAKNRVDTARFAMQSPGLCTRS